MVKVNLSDYKNLYIQTAKEYINSLLVGCDKLINDSQDKDAVNQMHIDSHSLKSQSQVMGFANMASLSAIIGKISSAAIEGRYQITTDFIVVMKDSISQLDLCLSQIEKENTEKDLSEFVKKLEVVSGGVV